MVLRAGVSTLHSFFSDVILSHIDIGRFAFGMHGVLKSELRRRFYGYRSTARDSDWGSDY